MKRDDLNLLKDPSVELIKPYIFSSRDIEHDRDRLTAQHWAEVCTAQGGYNPKTRELTPMKFAATAMAVCDALDHITAAVEAGVVDQNRWATQLFANAGELEGFLQELESYDDCYRITDRWWTALAGLADRCDEEAFVSCAEIVDGLRESIDHGARRCEVLRQEADYFAQNPLKTVKATSAQSRALDVHNVELRRKHALFGSQRDVSYEFRFTQPYCYLKGKVLAVRQVTTDDLTKLLASHTKKSPTKAKPAATKPAKPSVK